ncbi:MAG: hypothetical protein RRX92_08935 [Lachnospiraceae bacterium]
MSNPMSVDNGKDVTALFNNLSMGNANTPQGVNLADYSSIKNGSYKKVLNAYYAKNAKSETTDTEKSLSRLKTSADSMTKAADAIVNSKTLFEKKLIKTKDELTGKETEVEDYDREAIGKAMKNFVKEYNSFIDSAGKSDTGSVLKRTLWLTNMTKEHADLLGEVGISVGKDNKLEIDEGDLKKANITTLKTLFQGHNSYADKVSGKGNQISNDAAAAAAKMLKTYSQHGTFPKVEASGKFYDSSL